MSDKPLAWLKEWTVDGDPRVRVDLHPGLDNWMQQYDVKVTPLYQKPADTEGKAQ